MYRGKDPMVFKGVSCNRLIILSCIGRLRFIEKVITESNSSESKSGRRDKCVREVVGYYTVVGSEEISHKAKCQLLLWFFGTG